MGKAWVVNENNPDKGTHGKLIRRGKELPGFYVQYYDEEGNRKTKTPPFKTLKEAFEWRDEWNFKEEADRRGAVFSNIVAQEDRVLLNDACDEFVRTQTPGLDRDTASQYRRAVAYLKAAVNNRRAYIDDVRPHHCETIFAEIRKEGRSEATVQKALFGLRRFFIWCVESRKILKENPLKACKNKPTTQAIERQRPNLTIKDVERLCKLVETVDQYWTIQLAVTTGQDRTFLAHLTPSQINWDTGTMRWHRLKTKRPFNIPLQTAVLAELRKRAASMGPDDRFFRGVLPTGSAYMDEDASDDEQSLMADWWRRVRKAAKLEHVLFRDLRAFATRRLLEAGLSMKQVAEFLGHASQTTTQRHYTMPDPDAQSKVVALPLVGTRPRKARKAS